MSSGSRLWELTPTWSRHCAWMDTKLAVKAAQAPAPLVTLCVGAPTASAWFPRMKCAMCRKVTPYSCNQVETSFLHVFSNCRSFIVNVSHLRFSLCFSSSLCSTECWCQLGLWVWISHSFLGTQPWGNCIWRICPRKRWLCLNLQQHWDNMHIPGLVVWPHLLYHC